MKKCYWMTVTGTNTITVKDLLVGMCGFAAVSPSCSFDFATASTPTGILLRIRTPLSPQ